MDDITDIAAGSTNGRQVFIGNISTLKKSFGFIRSSTFASDVFFHQYAISSGDDMQLAAGDTVEFVLEPQQQPGKKVAAKVWRSSRQHNMIEIRPNICYGCVSIYEASGSHGSGVLRYMDQQGVVQHLTFSSKDLISSITQDTIVPGSSVTFNVLINLQQKAMAEAAGPPGPRAVHAYMRATNIQLLSEDSQAALQPNIQRQLAVLQAVSETCDHPTRP